MNIVKHFKFLKALFFIADKLAYIVLISNIVSSILCMLTGEYKMACVWVVASIWTLMYITKSPTEIEIIIVHENEGAEGSAAPAPSGATTKGFPCE